MKLFNRQKRKPILPLIALLFLILFLPAAYYLSTHPRSIEAAWFNDAWAYRQPIAIPSHTATENNVYVTVPAFDATDTTKFQADCGDLRFTKQNGELLPYYVVDCDSTANIHVQFDTLPAGASTYYMYYGNPSAPNGTEAADFATPASGLGSQSAGSEEKSQGPVAYWKFDDASGTSAQDATANNNDGTITGATWQTEDQCVSGKCLRFNGTDNVIQVNNSPSIAAASWTFSSWVRWTGANAGGFGGIVERLGGSNNTNSSRILIVDSTSKIIVQSGTGSTLITSNRTLNKNQWYLITVTQSGGTPILYIDGMLDTTGTTGAFATGTSPVYLGRGSVSSSTYYLNGFIDEVKIYNYARSAAQIKSDFKSRGTSKGTSASLGSNIQNLGSLSDGLVGYWKMDESSGNTADSSGNSLTLTNNGTTTFAAGKFGNASSHNGTTQYFSTATTISGVQTVAFWVNPASTTDNFINLITGSAYIVSSSGTVTGTGFTSPAVYVNGVLNGTLTASAWNHVVVTSTAGISASAFEAGRANGSYLTNTGKIDDVRIYNRALTPSEVEGLYRWAPGPVGYWNFDEKTGQAANDISGNGNSGTLGATSSPASDDPTWTTGKFGGGLTLDGSNDYVNVPDTTSLQITGTVTVEAWVNYSELGSYRNTVGKFKAGDTTAYSYGFRKGNTDFVFADFYVNGGRITAVDTSTVPINTWVHYAATYDGSYVNLYRNGVRVVRTAASGSIDSSVGTTLGIGTSGGYSVFKGKMDDVKVYNYARTNKQIVEDMLGGRSSVTSGGSNAGSTVYWKFDEGYGGTAYDTGPNKINGTISNGTWSNSGKFGKTVTFGATTSVTATITDPGYSNTISLWINPTTSAASKTLVTAAKLTTDSSSRPVYGGCTGTALSLSTWTHIVAVSDGSGSCKIYQNGIQTASSTTGVTFGTSVNIGASSFTGTIDEVKIYNFALTAEEIKLDYNRGSAQVLGALGNNSSYSSNASNQQYCVPGDSTSCSAPVGEWNFEEKQGTSANDTSGNVNTGTLASGTTWVTGKVGSAIDFNGTNGIVSTGITSHPTSFTVEAWANADVTDSPSDTIISKFKASPYDGFFLRHMNGTMSAAVYNAGTGYTSTTTITAGGWNHWVMTFDGSTIKLYKNGVLADSDAGTMGSNTTALIIGGNYGTANEPFNGKIDQVRYFNYARTAAQIAWDYNRGGPVGWWKFDECQGTVANDSSGNGNSGTITIGATVPQTSAGTCTTVNTATAWYNGATGKFNSSMSFDGADDYVNISQVLPTAVTTPFTFSSWVNPASAGAGTWRTIIGTNISLAEIAIGSNNRFACGQNAGGGFFDYSPASLTITNGSWYLVTCTYDGTYIRIYINGQLVTGPTSRTFTNASHGTTVLGRYQTGGGEWMNGQIDDVRVYNYALTATQVKQLYNGGAGVKFGPTTGSP